MLDLFLENEMYLPLGSNFLVGQGHQFETSGARPVVATVVENRAEPVLSTLVPRNPSERAVPPRVTPKCLKISQPALLGHGETLG